MGYNVDDRVRGIIVQPRTDAGNFTSLLRNFQILDLDRKIKKKRLKHKEIEPEFNSHYGTDIAVKAKWQALCQDCGLYPSISKCKKVQSLPAICSNCAAVDACCY